MSKNLQSARKFRKAMNPLYQFREPGDILEGRIVSKGTLQVDDREVPFIDVQTESEEIYKLFLGSAGLASIHQNCPLELGHTIAVRYDGENPAFEKRGNPMKEYSYFYE